MKYAKRSRCNDGRLRGGPDGTLYAGFLWRWRFNRCATCDVLVLPYMIRYVDWRWLAYACRRAWRARNDWRL